MITARLVQKFSYVDVNRFNNNASEADIAWGAIFYRVHNDSINLFQLFPHHTHNFISDLKIL